MRRLLTAGLLFLMGAVASGLAVPRLHGQAVKVPDQQTVMFDVTSVKPNTSGDDSVARIESPNGFNITNATLQVVIRWAYRVQDFQIIDGPSWLTTARFDVVGKAETSVPDEDRRLMLRALLVDRFMLVVHNDTRELPVYALVAARRMASSDLNFGGRPFVRAPGAAIDPTGRSGADGFAANLLAQGVSRQHECPWG